MKKSIAVIALLILAAALLSGCNRTVFDTTYNFDEAIVFLPNGELIQGKVQTWRDFGDGDQIQVKIDGKTYLTHSANVVLIAGE